MTCDYCLRFCHQNHLVCLPIRYYSYGSSCFCWCHQWLSNARPSDRDWHAADAHFRSNQSQFPCSGFGAWRRNQDCVVGCYLDRFSCPLLPDTLINLLCLLRQIVWVDWHLILSWQRFNLLCLSEILLCYMRECCWLVLRRVSRPQLQTLVLYSQRLTHHQHQTEGMGYRREVRPEHHTLPWIFPRSHY